MSLYVWTPAMARQQIDKIEANIGEHALVHDMAYDLFYDLLAAISEGMCSDPAECARIALVADML